MSNREKSRENFKKWYYGMSPEARKEWNRKRNAKQQEKKKLKDSGTSSTESLSIPEVIENLSNW